MEKDNILTLMVTCYNQQDIIGKTIDSLINQKTEYEYKILISDDKSTDNSYDVLKEYQLRYDFIDVIRVEEKKKVGRNRNNLLANVKTKYACFVDGDDIQSDNFVQQIISSLNGKLLYHLRGFDEVWENYTQRKYSRYYENVFLYVFSKDIIEKVKFNEDIEIGEDYAFSLQYYDILNSDYEYIDAYYKLNRGVENKSLTKNGDISKRYDLEIKLYDLIKVYENNNSNVAAKVNEKKIDLINYAVLTDRETLTDKVQLKGVRTKHKLTYILFKILSIFRLKRVYKYIINKFIGHKI